MHLHGLLVGVNIGISKRLKRVLVETGGDIPKSVATVAMIDTGAQKTVVIPSVIAELRLEPVGQIDLLGVGQVNASLCDLYDVDVTCQGVDKRRIAIQNCRAICQTLPDMQIECLIGCDILRRAVLTYIGPEERFILSFNESPFIDPEAPSLK